MTVSERAFPQSLREKLEQRKLPADAPEKPDDTGDIARRLIDYMIEADRRRFIIALIVRLVGDISLILVPVFTGRGGRQRAGNAQAHRHLGESNHQNLGAAQDDASSAVFDGEAQLDAELAGVPGFDRFVTAFET